MSLIFSTLSNGWNSIIGSGNQSLGMPKENHKNKSDSYKDEKKEEIIIKEKYNKILDVLTNNIKIQTKNKITCTIDIKDLVDLDLEMYMYQRQKNEEHIKKLEEGIKKTGYLYHNIILVDIPSKYTISIVDGQHRYEALKYIVSHSVNNLNENTTRPYQNEVPQSQHSWQGEGTHNGESISTIGIDVIKIDDENNLIELYESINHYLPHDMEKIREDRRYIEFVKMIKEKFGDKSITDNQVNRKHYLREKLLKEKIQEEKLLSKYTEEELCERIIAYNKKKGKEILKDKKKYSSSLKDIERCKERNFWLGFKPIDDWIKNL